jgi:hypothetical protein
MALQCLWCVCDALLSTSEFVVSLMLMSQTQENDHRTPLSSLSEPLPLPLLFPSYLYASPVSSLLLPLPTP